MNSTAALIEMVFTLKMYVMNKYINSYENRESVSYTELQNCLHNISLSLTCIENYIKDEELKK